MQQLKKIYLCNNADLPCKYFIERTEFVLRPGEEERCPACRKADISLVRTEGGASVSGRKRTRWLIGTVLILLAGIVYWVIDGQKPTKTTSATPTTTKPAKEMVPDPGKPHAAQDSVRAQPPGDGNAGDGKKTDIPKDTVADTNAGAGKKHKPPPYRDPVAPKQDLAPPHNSEAPDVKAQPGKVH